MPFNKNMAKDLNLPNPRSHVMSGRRYSERLRFYRSL